MKKLIFFLVILLLIGGGVAYFLLKPQEKSAESEAAQLPETKFSSHLDLPVMPVPIIDNGKAQGALFLKLKLLFLSEENDIKTRRVLPYLYDHLLREMHTIAPHKSIASGKIDPPTLEKRLQGIVDDLIGKDVATIRIVNIALSEQK